MICCCVRNHSKIESPDFPVTGEMPKPQTPILPAHDLGGLSIPQLPWTSPVSFSRYMGISITLPFLERPLRFPSAAFDPADIFCFFVFCFFSGNGLPLRDHSWSRGVPSEFCSDEISVFASDRELRDRGRAPSPPSRPPGAHRRSNESSESRCPQLTSVSATCHSP